MAMLTKEQFHKKISQGVCFLDGATGSNLINAGMPRGCCTEKWILNNPQALTALQQEYAAAGSDIIYAPTFQAQPIALKKEGLEDKCQQINTQLVQLTRSACPGKLVAGNLATLAAFIDSADSGNFDLLVENYRVQIRGLIQGGVDLFAAETLLYPQEAEAIFTAVEMESPEAAVMFCFTMQPDGSLFSGMDAGKVLRELEEAGAAAVGFNCVGADMMTPYLVSKLRRSVKGPLICKPNAGNPVIGDDNLPHYSMTPEEFSRIIAQCSQMGATLLGGCCGTTPAYIAALKD